jgi:hypothetical protein
VPSIRLQLALFIQNYHFTDEGGRLFPISGPFRSSANRGLPSADYIHLYHGNAPLLAESLEVVQKTSAVILSALETAETEAVNETEPELAQAS